MTWTLPTRAIIQNLLRFHLQPHLAAKLCYYDQARRLRFSQPLVRLMANALQNHSLDLRPTAPLLRFRVGALLKFAFACSLQLTGLYCLRSHHIRCLDSEQRSQCGADDEEPPNQVLALSQRLRHSLSSRSPRCAPRFRREFASCQILLRSYKYYKFSLLVLISCLMCTTTV